MEEELINFVRSHEFLYKKNHRNHKNTLLRNKKFEELSRKIGVPDKKLKERWRTLRDKFHKDIKNESSSISKRKWKWMDKLSFLRDVGNANTTGQTIKDDNSLLESPLYTDDFSAADEFASSSTSAYFTETKVDEVLLNRRKDLSNIESFSMESLMEKRNSNQLAVEHFFAGLAKQTADADLSPHKFALLQIEILKAFNKIVYESYLLVIFRSASEKCRN